MSEHFSIDRYDSDDQSELFNYLNIDGDYGDDLDEYEDDYEDDDEIYSDGAIDDLDFSNLSGGFKKSFRKVNRKVEQKPRSRQRMRSRQEPRSERKIQKVIAPENRKVIVQGEKRIKRIKHPTPQKPKQKRRKPTRKRSVGKKRRVREVGVKQSVGLRGKKSKKISKIIVPRDKEVIIKGVNEFILSDDQNDNFIKNIRRYKGKKLQDLIFTFNNSDSALDFDFELFNPSMPLDYLQSTGLNINDKISVNGSENTKYTDVLYNILANPTMLVNAQFVFNGPDLSNQINQALKYNNKSLEAIGILTPQQISLQLDRYQFANNIVYFNIAENINRPVCPDGMDVMIYKILAGMTVTFAFYYKQVSTKKVYFPAARKSNKLI